MKCRWDECAELNILRGSVIVTYAPNSGALVSFAARTGRHMGNDRGKAELIAPSRLEGPIDIWSCRQDPSLSMAPAEQSSSARADLTPDVFPSTLDALSSRQRDVLNFIVQGLSNKEIARALDLAEGTIKIHVAALFAKLGVRRRAALAVAGAELLSQNAGLAQNRNMHVMAIA